MEERSCQSRRRLGPRRRERSRRAILEVPDRHWLWIAISAGIAIVIWLSNLIEGKTLVRANGLRWWMTIGSTPRISSPTLVPRLAPSPIRVSVAESSLRICLQHETRLGWINTRGRTDMAGRNSSIVVRHLADRRRVGGPGSKC